MFFNESYALRTQAFSYTYAFVLEKVFLTGFDIPTDRNKQPLVWLDYEVHADGSVLVKTYHRTHPAAPEFARNELQDINEGDPADIPHDQFISVRVQMPQNSIWNQHAAISDAPDSSAG